MGSGIPSSVGSTTKKVLSVRRAPKTLLSQRTCVLLAARACAIAHARTRQTWRSETCEIYIFIVRNQNK
jgi:hypothetical protein